MGCGCGGRKNVNMRRATMPIKRGSVTVSTQNTKPAVNISGLAVNNTMSADAKKDLEKRRREQILRKFGKI